MALTKCDVPTDVIGSLGTTPEERGLTTQEFKDKFDEMPEGIKDYLNNTLTVEIDSHLAESTTYMGYLERDATLPTGLQSIVGLGFKPKSILLFASSVAAGTKFSVGFDNGVSHLTLYNNYIPSGGAFVGTVGVSVFLRESSANSNSAFIQSFDTDGFTLSWETNGTPINKNRVYYVAFR